MDELTSSNQALIIRQPGDYLKTSHRKLVKASLDLVTDVKQNIIPKSVPSKCDLNCKLYIIPASNIHLQLYGVLLVVQMYIVYLSLVGDLTVMLCFRVKTVASTADLSLWSFIAAPLKSRRAILRRYYRLRIKFRGNVDKKGNEIHNLPINCFRNHWRLTLLTTRPPRSIALSNSWRLNYSFVSIV